MKKEENQNKVLFVPCKKLDEFYNLFVIALFLKFYDGISFSSYISKNCFRALYGNRETTLFLFNAPQKGKNLTDYYVFQMRISRNDDRHVKTNEAFVREYKAFLDNPYNYIRENLFYGYELFSFFKQHDIYGFDYTDSSLYKYKGLNTKDEAKKNEELNKYLNNLLSGKLTFTNPKFFNDPFDCDCEIPLGLKKYYVELICSIGKGLDKDSITKKEIKKRLNEVWDKALDSEESLFNMIHNLICDIYKTDNINVEDLRREICQNEDELMNIKEAFRVLCMAKDPKDILMWGYYCNGGEGVSVEFKQKNILDSLKKENNKIIFWGDVEYRKTDKKPRFKSDFSTDSYDIMKFVLECIFTKYYVWSHEKERRFVMLDVKGFDSNYYDVSSARDTYYIGVKTSLDQMIKLHCHCDKHDKHIQLKKHPTKYALVDVI